MKRRLLFAILLAIVLGLILKYGASAAPIYPSFQARYAASYRAELDHFAQVLAGEAAPQTGYQESLDALGMAEAALRSLASGASEPVERERGRD